MSTTELTRSRSVEEQSRLLAIPLPSLPPDPDGRPREAALFLSLQRCGEVVEVLLGQRTTSFGAASTFLGGVLTVRQTDR